MLTEKEFERLPGLAQEIVKNGRELEAAMEGEVIPFAMAAKVKELGDRKRELTRHAAKLWGQSAKKDGAGPSHA